MRESFRADLQNPCKGAQVGADRNRTGVAFRATVERENPAICRGFNWLDYLCLFIVATAIPVWLTVGGVLLSQLLGSAA